ncbi:inverse autotransporter beta domain-containing protein [Ferrovibrio sp.]|uniref:inverse autotransporter beta domain-containing protein n=1 Tax=Ferrovibrio sp. TaxID=1917215 RepID=UPI0035184563
MPIRIALLLTVAAVAAWPCMAGAADKWQPHVEAGGKLGNQRSIGESDLFLPLLQDDSALLFADLRAKLDDSNSREGNLGLGFRQIIAGSWIAGGYAFYDRRRTETGNLFNQATLGAEILGETWDLRLNGYLPQGGAQTIPGTGGGGSVGLLSGSSFLVQSRTESRERALPGFDAELGYRLPFDGIDLRLFAGGFYFDAPDFPSVTGPRARLEAGWDDLPLLGAGSRLTLGGEVQTDNIRGDQGFLMARLRIPLNFGEPQPKLSAIERRMTTYVERDVDIVAGSRLGGTKTEAATATLANGTSVSSFTTVDAAGNLITAATGAGANSLLVVDGAAGTVNVGAPVNLSSGQMIVGGGSTITVTSATGQTASVTLPGSAATVNGTSAINNVFNMATGSSLTGLTITGGQNAVTMTAANNVRLSNLTISNTAQNGVEVSGSDGLTISNVSMNNMGSGTGFGVQFNSSSNNASFSSLTVSNSAIGVRFASGGTYNNVSFASTTMTSLTNGVFVQAAATLGSPSGSITTTTVTTPCNNAGTITGSTLQINGTPCN